MSTGDEVGPLCAPAAMRSRGNGQQYPTWQRTFWSKPISLFGLFQLTVLTSIHLV